MNYKTLLAAVVLMAASSIAQARVRYVQEQEEQIEEPRILDVGDNEAIQRGGQDVAFGTKQGPFYQYEYPAGSGKYYSAYDIDYVRDYYQDDGYYGGCPNCPSACPSCPSYDCPTCDIGCPTCGTRGYHRRGYYSPVVY